MITRSKQASAGSSLPAAVLSSIVALVAALFCMIQSAYALPQTGVAKTATAPLVSKALDESQMPLVPRIDRWQPFIREASSRYSVPETWIRAIINIESGGRTIVCGHPITSGAGAVGVMQLMRATYKQISARDGLGSDPNNVHDNILAGTAYLRDLYNKFGFPSLFAAYNAGPGLLQAHLFHRKALPPETQNYMRMATAGATHATLTSTDLHALVKTSRAA